MRTDARVRKDGEDVSTGQPELFEGVDFGPRRRSLAKARALVADVHGLYELEYAIDDAALRLAKVAKSCGAHALARALCYLASREAFYRRGPDALHIRAEHAAHRWLARIEAEATR